MEKRAFPIGTYLPPILLALVSGLCYGSGWLAWLFLIPIRIVESFFGFRSAAAAGSLSVAIAVTIQVVMLRSGLLNANPLFIAALVLIPGLLIGLSLAADLPVFGKIPAIYRVFIIALAASALSLPAILDFEKDPFFAEAIKKGLAPFANQEASPEENYELSVLRKQFDPDALLGLVKSMLINSFAAIYFVFFAGSRWMGRKVFSLVKRRALAPPSYGFRLPQPLIWPFLVCLASVLASRFVDLGFLGIIAWNCGLMLLFLYGVQGSAIISFFLRRFGASPATRLLITLAIVSLIFTPILGVAIIVCFPCLGLFETWIPFRSKGVDHEDHT